MFQERFTAQLLGNNVGIELPLTGEIVADKTIFFFQTFIERCVSRGIEQADPGNRTAGACDKIFDFGKDTFIIMIETDDHAEKRHNAVAGNPVDPFENVEF